MAAVDIPDTFAFFYSEQHRNKFFKRQPKYCGTGGRNLDTYITAVSAPAQQLVLATAIQPTPLDGVLHSLLLYHNFVSVLMGDTAKPSNTTVAEALQLLNEKNENHMADVWSRISQTHLELSRVVASVPKLVER
ncbi:hypothetical protein OUZ56_008256 [Daphnia magna]|uniref:Uncharacterized protein n=1 Tax=Daphnia magna TaxID=35525 RepID=A0ABR0ACP1_9CRUS|nr:hypothetical protein OUZ56_008256 [Daphnia magna]